MRGMKNDPAGAKKTLWRDQRGMALLITIMTVSLLVVVTMQYHKTTWQKLLVSSNYSVGSQLKVITDSGINIGLALLQHDATENQSDSLFDSWATVGNERFSGLFPKGRLGLDIVDLSGRLQVNSLIQEEEKSEEEENNNLADVIRGMLLRLLLSGSFQIEDEGEARSIVDAIVDWVDEDDKESDYGAESSYYQSLEKPYSCRNGPVHYMEVMLLIKGMTPALLFGSGESKGLANYLTIHGNDGKININTASLPVIRSFDSLISDELIEKFDEYRSDEENEDNLASHDWYNNIDGWPGDIVLNEKLLTTTSRYFQITATGEFDTLTRRMVAVAERVDEQEVNLLGKKAE